MNKETLQAIGLIEINSRTRTKTFAWIKEDSLYADQVANRPSVEWKKAEFIFIKDKVMPGNTGKLLEAWRNLKWNDQYLVFSNGDGDKLHDGKGRLISKGTIEILSFIRQQLCHDNDSGEFVSISPHPFNDSQAKELNPAADPLMMRLMAALRTKPFAILAGHSGTGKSRMVRKLAYMTCCDEGLRKDGEGKWLDQPGNFCMIQVKPNWHDNSELLGYYSEMKGAYKTTDFVRFVCKAYAYPDVPFFVCLDEMNLAPVEHYFAEYLSAIESAKLEEAGNRKVQITDPLIPKEKSLYSHPTDLGAETKQAVEWIAAHGLTIPKNLFVVGTVNMDETTCQFSRKVLDRAMTIEMAQVDFNSFGLKSAKPSFDDTLKCAEIAKLLDGEVDADELTDEQKRKLNALKNVLEKTPFMIAYRFANEYALYAKSLAAFNGGNAAEEVAAAEAFDDMVLMKALPRIAGERSVVEKIFGNEGEGLTRLVGEGSKSAFKMSEIIERGDNYLSFWP